MDYIGCPYQIKPEDYPANEIDPCEFCPCDDVDVPYPAICRNYENFILINPDDDTAEPLDDLIF